MVVSGGDTRSNTTTRALLHKNSTPTTIPLTQIDTSHDSWLSDKTYG
jgi:hypothetical protein